ncbi:MAG: C25 family cysteine peptidase, partial [Candidatus Cloacimonadaceae bacterium]|nr:C25 family cysteine peptidase [Candidatus Cloacimonadaceae bacterium]
MKVLRSIGLLVVLLMTTSLSLFSQAIPSETQFSILRSSTDSIQLRFELPQWKLESTVQNGETRHKISVKDAHYIFIDEEETLPVFTTTIAIPYSGGASLSPLGTANPNRSRVTLDFDDLLSRERTAGRYSDALYPASSSVISEPKVIRDFRVVSINIYPFQYDQSSKQLIVNESMDIQISFDRNPSINEIEPPTQISRSFESIYRGLILNYDEMITRNTVYQNPVMLVIWGFNSDTIYQGKVNEYINWKKQKGYKVYSASTSTTGTTNTAIKTYIQNAYNTWTDKPEHIVLIGDITGSMIVPTFETYKDYHYTWLAGGDGLGDVFIGRISVENSSQLVSYVAKMYMMERDINPANVSWMNSMLLVGDTASSGISTIYTNEYIYDVSSHVNSDYTYTKLYGANPSPANMNTAINQGVSFFNYRGYIGMSGWGGQNHDALLLNNNKPFHAVIITCSTGDINNTATTETIVRLGTEAQVRGAFTAIGMATSLTSTPMNNCLDVGIFHAIYPLGMRNMGAAMLYGKLYLNAIYGVSKPTQATNFAAYCNLVGDPTAAVYVGIPNSFIASTPSTIPAGTNLVELTVRNSSNQIVSGASVTITNAAGTLQALGSSNVQGYVVLDLPPSLTGSLVVTISKDDFKPLVNTISISTTGGIVFEEVWADDGNSGNSTGNGDGIVNGGENIELWVTLRNSSTAALSVSGTVSCTDPYITIPDNRISFGNISAGGTAMNTEALFFLVAANCPDNRRVVFNLSGTTPSGPWTVGIPIIIRNGKLNIQSYSIVGAPGNVINPGNQYPMTFTLNNTGLADLAGVSGILRSYDGLFTIPDSLGYFGNIASGASANNALNTFQVFASGQSVVGMTVPLELYLYNSQGYSESKSLTLTIGQTTVNHPLGQDAYGYFIFDMGDAGYPQRPTYNWIGIAPAEGGTGTALTLTDPGAVSDEGDQVGAVSITTVNLPFPFKFYGRSYTQASISANGFIAFGSTTDSDWRNWRLPGAGGPNPMIAAFWDDLQLNAGSYVYTFYNASQRYYVVEWYNVISGFDRVTPLTFQAILYDPVYYPTQTGDGQIKLQYKVFNNIDTGSGDTNPHGNYATIGIKDHNGTVGLEYTFNNQYPAAAAPLSNLSALFVTTRPILLNNPYLAIGQINILDANGNGNLDSGENANLSIRLTNLGTQPATNVSAILSTTSPFVTVTTANANYGTIAASANGDPLSNFAITVANNCPNGHLASFALAITSSQGTWNNDFTLPLHAPALAFGTMIISDPAPGNNNGRLDPGETVTISMPLNNTGGTASQSGSATLTSPTIGISISGSPAGFGSIATGGSVYLNYTISASAGMSVGTLATFNFNATAAAYTATKTENISIGLIMEDFESGTFTAFPWTFSGNLPWTITGTGAYAGTYAAKSGTITHSQTSSMQTTRVLAASGTLTFWYKVTSEGNYDYLRFYVDEVLQNSPGWAGTIGWTQASYTLAAGTRALRWEYMKDGSVSTGDDCAWIDNIVFPAS